MEALATFHPLLRTVHLTLALTSGGLFLVRGIGVLAGSAIPVSLPVRRLSHVLDATLLLSALLLLLTLRLNPFATPWLLAKLGFLVAYIGFGMVALHRGRTPAVRAVTFALALFCFAMIYTVARSHHPLGMLR